MEVIHGVVLQMRFSILLILTGKNGQKISVAWPRSQLVTMLGLKSGGPFHYSMLCIQDSR